MMHSEGIEDVGIVTQIEGNRITVQIEKGGGCKSCGMKGLCGRNNRPIILHFDTGGGYKVGDKVEISVTSGIKLLSAILIFALPLLALFVFYIIGSKLLGANELVSVLLGFAGLNIAFLVVRLLDKRIGKHINYRLGSKHEDMPE